MDNERIEDLKRRIQKDPWSIAFAQLGEEYRRAGRSQEAIEICRTGLEHHPGYLSARVTLGRALLDTGALEQAEHELKEVLRVAPENLAALRGVAEALGRRGNDASALAHYEMALALAPRDLELQHTVASLREHVRPRAATAPSLAQPPVVAAPVTEAPAAPPSGAAGAVPPEAPTAPRPETVEVPPAASVPAQKASTGLPVLERWLELIVTDRQQRLSAGGA
jgi:tetratricopeptide (TPR) repeat protein